MKKNLSAKIRALLLTAVVFGFGLETLRALNVTDGLVAYWPLDAINGDNTVSDQTYFTNTLTAVGAPTVVAGQVTNAISLNGTSQYLSLSHTTNFNDPAGLPIYDAAAGYTVTLWVKAPAVGTGNNLNDHYLFAEGNTTNNNPLLLFQTRNAADTTPADTNKLFIGVRSLGGGFILPQVKSATVVLDNTWHHIAWVDNHGAAKLYVDGNLDAANFNYTYAATPFNTTAIGALVRAAIAGFFKGAVDNAALWERPLSQSEVQSVMTNSIPTPIPVQPPIMVSAPVSRTNSMGDRATFSIVAIGLHPLQYQWYKDGVLLPNGTAATFAATDLTMAATNVYTVVVSNIFGAITNSATLTVLADAAPNPANGIISYWPFDTVNVTATATNTPDVYYSHTDLALKFMDVNNLIPGVYSNALFFNGTTQYGQRTGGTPVFNQTNYTIAFWANGQPGQVNKILYGEGDPASGQFFLMGTEDSASSAGSISLKASPLATFPDKKSTRTVFDSTWHHVCWVDENGKAELYIDGVLDETDYTYTRSNLSLSITAVGALVRGTPSLWFSGFMDDVATWNRRLSYTEIQQIRTNSIPPPALTVPSISQNPVSSTNALGDRITLTVNASGSAPLVYQWFKNGVAVSGATNSSLVLLMTSASTNTYSVTITNQANSVTSTVAQVSYVPDPPASVTNGLLNYWPLDVVTAPPTNSSPDLASGDDLFLTAMDNTALTSGEFGQALFFNGNGQFGQRVGGVPIYPFTNYSVSVWVNASPGQLNKMVYAEGGAGGNFFLLGTESSAPDTGLLNVKVSPGMSDRKSTRTVFDNTWHHIAWVDRNGAGKLYVDGVMDETSYAYPRTNLSLQTSAVGALVRTTPSLFFTGDIDDVAVWDRALSWTEITQVHNGSIPTPIAPLPPAIFQQPANIGVQVFAGDAASYSVTAFGTMPLSYQWRLNGTNVDGNANPSALTSGLSFSAVQTNNAGTYDVVITNTAGAVTSSVVSLVVIPYIPAVNGTVLALDFDLTNAPNIQPGFSEMNLALSGTNFGGVAVTVSPIGSIVLSDRERLPGILDNPPALTQSRLYNDFIFANNVTNGTGLRVLISRLAPNTPYGLTIWSWDGGSVGPRVSDWVEALSGQPIVSGYSFDGSILPASDYDDTFGAVVTSSASGQLQIEGRNNNSTLNVFLNALQLVANPSIVITSFGFVPDGNLQLVVQTKYPGQPIVFQESADLSPGSWQNATDGTVTQTHGPIVIAEFPPSATQLYYRVGPQ